MRFLVIEGLDGSGKTTQVSMMKNYLEKNNIRFRYLHFPRLEEGVYGKLIARFLRGEMGDINAVDPYLVALIFAGDRNDAREMIGEWIDNDELVLIDRYVYSNLAFQCAKMNDQAAQQELADWIINLEFDVHKLPVPDMNIFLDVPMDFTRQQLSRSRAGKDREYLNGQQDIHEQDIRFQEKVRHLYLDLAARFENIRVINCADHEGRMLPPGDVFDKLIGVTGNLK